MRRTRQVCLTDTGHCELWLAIQDALVAGSERKIVDVDVGLHQRSALSPYLVIVFMDALRYDVRK